MGAKTYTIKSARNAGIKPNPHGGELVKWYLDLESGETDVYTQKKPGNDLEVGQEVYGRIEEGEYGLRFYSEQNPNVQFPTKPGHSKSRDPDLDHRIARQVAFKGAVELVAAGGAANRPDAIDVVANLTEKLLPIIEGPEFLPDQVKNVAQTLSAGPQTPSQPAQQPQGPDNGDSPTPTKEVLRKAFAEYVKKGGPEAKDRVKLKLTSMGISNDISDLTGEEAEQLLKFLRG